VSRHPAESHSGHRERSGERRFVADRAAGSEAHWIPLSDLMTGLMVMFLLIAVCYMIRVEADAGRIKTVARCVQ